MGKCPLDLLPLLFLPLRLCGARQGQTQTCAGSVCFLGRYAEVRQNGQSNGKPIKIQWAKPRKNREKAKEKLGRKPWLSYPLCDGSFGKKVRGRRAFALDTGRAGQPCEDPDLFRTIPLVLTATPIFRHSICSHENGT